MKDDTGRSVSDPGSCPRDVLTEILRAHARELLVAVLDAEVVEYVEAFRELRDAKGLRLVVRNGYKPEREVQTGLGAVPVKPPRNLTWLFRLNETIRSAPPVG